MGLVYKIDVMAALKEAGATTYAIRKNPQSIGYDKPPFNETALQQIRSKQPINWKNLETICEITKLQPGDILEYVEDEK